MDNINIKTNNNFKNYKYSKNYAYSIINNLKEKYSFELNKVKREYEFISMKYNKSKMRKCMDNQKKLIIDIINDVINYYPDLKKSDFIMLNGSYSRCTNIFTSDLDFNILYNDKYKKLLFPIELHINYVLTKILNYRGCDRIHTIMVYTPLIKNKRVKFVNNSVIKYNFKKIPYFCRENYEKLLYETFNTSRNYKNLIKYIKSYSYNNSICNEWANNFELIKDFGKYKDFAKEILINDNYVSKCKNYKNLIIKEIDYILHDIRNSKNIEQKEVVVIKDFKYSCKECPMKILYKTLSILSRINNINTVNIKYLYSKKIINNSLDDSIHYYLHSILRLQLILDLYGLDLSSHSSKIINSSTLEKKYYEKYDESLYFITNKSIANLYNNIISTLQKERSKLI